MVTMLTVLAGCDKPDSSKPKSVSSPLRPVMGTFARSICVADDEKTAKLGNKAAYKKLVAIDKMMSDYLEESQLSKVNNNAFTEPVKVDDELFHVISKSIEYSQMSEGAFDITIGPVVDLWHKAEESKQKPTSAQIAAAKSKVGYEKLILDPVNKTVKFNVEGMRLDLGAIAKGYAIDQAIEAMKQTGATGGMIDAGGDIRCFGKPAKKTKWAIGLQSPDEDSELLMVIELGNKSIATSGDYQRFVILDGQKYSHIMEPAKAKSTKGLTSVTVVAEKAIDSDALATTVTVMGIEKGLKLLDSIEGAEGYIVPSDPEKKIRFTAGFDNYIRKEKS